METINRQQTSEYLKELFDTPIEIQETEHLIKNKVAQFLDKQNPSTGDKLAALFAKKREVIDENIDKPESFEDMTKRTFGLETVTEFLGISEAVNDETYKQKQVVNA